MYSAIAAALLALLVAWHCWQACWAAALAACLVSEPTWHLRSTLHSSSVLACDGYVFAVEAFAVCVGM